MQTRNADIEGNIRFDSGPKKVDSVDISIEVQEMKEDLKA